MEQPNRIDEILRQRLQQADVPPPDYVWSNIEQSLHRRRRRFFLWFIAAGLACVSIWLLWQRPGANQVLVAAPDTEIAPTGNTATTPANQATPATTTAENPARTTTPIDHSDRKTAGIPTGNTVVQATETPVSGPAPQRSQSATRAKGIVSVPAEAVAPLPAAGIETGGDTAPEVPAADPAAELPVSTAGLVPMAGQRQPDLLPGRLALLADPERPEVIKPIDLPAPPKKKVTKKCYDFHSNRQAWLIDAYVGPSLVRKELFTGNPEFRDHRLDRLNTEKQELAFNAGIRASYLFAENFLIRTGLHYDRFSEQFEYIDPNFIKYTVVITQEYINGEWTSVPDTVDIQYGSNYQKTYNRFSLLDIPLQAALELRSGPMGISLNLGGSVNLLFSKKGNMVALDGKPVTFTPGSGQYEIFKPRVGLSLLGSIQWFYHITPRTRVFAEPYYRHILDPVTESTYPLEQTYGIGGIRFGITQIFDRKL